MSLEALRRLESDLEQRTGQYPTDNSHVCNRGSNVQPGTPSEQVCEARPRMLRQQQGDRREQPGARRAQRARAALLAGVFVWKSDAIERHFLAMYTLRPTRSHAVPTAAADEQPATPKKKKKKKRPPAARVSEDDGPRDTESILPQ